MALLRNSDESSVNIHAEVVQLGLLLERLLQGRLRIPKFQRPFVWRPRQMLELLDSVRRKYPIGSILVWDTHEELESLDQVGPIPVPERPAGLVSYVLDGHQRLSTLLGALKLSAERPRNWEIYFDLEKEEFYHLRQPEPPSQSSRLRVSIATHLLLDTNAFLDECARIRYENEPAAGRELVDSARKLADTLIQYHVTQARVTEANLNIVARIFARLNSRGTRITSDQMISALTFRAGQFNLTQEIDLVREDLRDNGFPGIGARTILRILLAATGADIYDTDWTMAVEGSDRVSKSRSAGRRASAALSLDWQDLKDAVEQSRATLQGALDFLHREGVTNDRLLPYSLQLVLLCEFFRNCPKPTEAQSQSLRLWFWATSFTGHFATFNSVDAKDALAEIRDLASGSPSAREQFDHKFDALGRKPLGFPTRFDGRSARVRAFLLFLLSLKPRSLSSGELLDVDQVLSVGPQALRYILGRGLLRQAHSSPANRILTDLGHRGQAKAALLDLPREHEVMICASQGIEYTSLELLHEGRFEEFIQVRERWLMTRELEFMRSKGLAVSGTLQPEEPWPDADEDLESDEASLE